MTLCEYFRKQFSCRGSSIKTRIETDLFYFQSYIQPFVAEVVPLKQGLKLSRLLQPLKFVNRLQR